MVKAVYDNLELPSPRSTSRSAFSDDVSHTSLDYDPSFSTEPDSVVRAMFYGLGRRRNGRREQEFDQDHWREYARTTPRDTLFTTPKSRAP